MRKLATLLAKLRYPRRVKVMRTVLIYMAGIVLGVAVGLWTASMTDDCPFSCVSGPPRFTTLDCVLMGWCAAAALLVVAVAVSRDFLPATAESYRTVTRFLFEDLSGQREH
jgi:hypothetical protein